ncbi:MAG: UDP-3-O-acyl-N-acetylglucosamine deacetylase [Candidatus Omnitrophica bacterium]|jgi:UDP-3-O-[3-hydroxymyristoyl] N-acetylglucosamine deacetylase/3-hydroxyacyl-[acyl-carrier-protein] dehydratase|nr:UDP-3-O-acyl-N-acetylglucosamine deacetylase [Candidatus Omnitrophota bacterium]MDD5079915.1 UDP-3-O-acyl-N-acetylglucosamine deacetylase [Candidatus Omnitrophota bacterium]
MEKQRTITKQISIKGTGLHTGNKVNLTFKPAPADNGINFIRVDLANKPAVKVCVENVSSQEGSLRFSHLEKDGVQIYTVEHLLAGLFGLGIDNLDIEIDNSEVCGLDGSSKGFIDTLSAAGICEQEKERKYISVKEPVMVQDAGASIAIFPSDKLKISYTLDYDNHFIKSDFLEIVVGSALFRDDIAPARTFCLEDEVEALKKKGLGKGANYENALVVGKKGVINNELRFEDEFVRHKVLDLLGDLYILGQPLKGHIIALKSGHSLNLKLVKKIAQQRPQTRQPSLTSGQSYSLPDGQTMDIEEIMRILPHRQPFLFVDRILQLDQGRRAVGIKNVTINDYFFKGHFPEKPVMPGVIILETMAQVGGVMLLSQAENRGKIAFFMSINNAKFRKVVIPGDQLVFEVTAVKLRSKTGQVHGQATVDGQVVAEADMMFAFGDS